MTSTEEFNACKQYLRKETKLGMEQMLPGHRQRVTTELILRYSNHFPKGCQVIECNSFTGLGVIPRGC